MFPVRATNRAILPILWRTPDYAFRATLPRTQAATAIADAIKAIAYPNFKDTVSEHDRHDAYEEMWFTMRELQEARARSLKP